MREESSQAIQRAGVCTGILIGLLSHMSVCGKLKSGQRHFSVNIQRKSINLNADRLFTPCSATMRGPHKCVSHEPAGKINCPLLHMAPSQCPGTQLPALINAGISSPKKANRTAIDS